MAEMGLYIQVRTVSTDENKTRHEERAPVTRCDQGDMFKHVQTKTEVLPALL